MWDYYEWATRFNNFMIYEISFQRTKIQKEKSHKLQFVKYWKRFQVDITQISAFLLRSYVDFRT